MTRDPWDAYQTDDPTQWAGREVLPEEAVDFARQTFPDARQWMEAA